MGSAYEGRPLATADIETRQLREVEALARLGSFAAASRALGLSQPALTRSIQRLERRVGSALFDRKSRGVILTPLGERFVLRARSLLSELEDLGRELQLLQGGEEAALRLGIGPSMRGLIVPRALRRLWRDHPKLRIEIISASVAELFQGLLARDIDLFIGDRGPAKLDQRFEIRALRSEKRIWVADPQHSLAVRPRSQRRPLHMNELEGHQLALPELSDLLPPGLLASQRAVKTLSVIECEDLQILVSLAVQGAAVAMVPKSAVREELRHGTLVALNVLPPLSDMRPLAIWLRDRPLSPGGEAFLDCLPRRAADAAKVEG